MLVTACMIFFLGMFFVLRSIYKGRTNSTNSEELLARIEDLQAKISRMEKVSAGFSDRLQALREENLVLEREKARLEKSKQRLTELQKTKDELFIMGVHDLKNPAGVIQNYAHLLEQYDLSQQEHSEIVANILTASARIIKLAEELSKLVAQNDNCGNLFLRKFLLNDIVNSVCKRYSILAENKEIEVKVETDQDLSEIEADKGQIYSVIENLLSNAIKFAPFQSTVTMKTKKDGNMAVLEIIDNGLGIEEENLKKVFQKGVTLGNKPTAGESSTGMGLWIVKNIVEAHQGYVYVKSHPGKGSTFGVKIPFFQQ